MGKFLKVLCASLLGAGLLTQPAAAPAQQGYANSQGGFGHSIDRPTGKYNPANYGNNGVVTPAIPSRSSIGVVKPGFGGYANQIWGANNHGGSNVLQPTQPPGVRFQNPNEGVNGGYYNDNPNPVANTQSRDEYNRQIGQQRLKEVYDCFQARKGQDNRGKKPCEPTTQWSYPPGTRLPRGSLLNQTANPSTGLPRGSLLNRTK